MLMVSGLGFARLVSAEGIKPPIQYESLEKLIAAIITYALGLTAVLAVGFIVYGGFMYITAAGDTKQIETGKTAIIGAVIGIIVIGLAYAIVEFVVNAMGAGGNTGPDGGAL